MTTSSSAKPAAGRDDGGIGKPDCPHCEGLGYVVPNVGPDDPSFGRAVACVCRAAEMERTRLDNLMSLNQAGFLEGMTFDSFVTAVSYTHLDVYKRQLLRRRSGTE